MAIHSYRNRVEHTMHYLIVLAKVAHTEQEEVRIIKSSSKKLLVKQVYIYVYMYATQPYLCISLYTQIYGTSTISSTIAICIRSMSLTYEHWIEIWSSHGSMAVHKISIGSLVLFGISLFVKRYPCGCSCC